MWTFAELARRPPGRPGAHPPRTELLTRRASHVQSPTGWPGLGDSLLISPASGCWSKPSISPLQRVASWGACWPVCGRLRRANGAPCHRELSRDRVIGIHSESMSEARAALSSSLPAAAPPARPRVWRAGRAQPDRRSRRGKAVCQSRTSRLVLTYLCRRGRLRWGLTRTVYSLLAAQVHPSRQTSLSSNRHPL